MTTFENPKDMSRHRFMAMAAMGISPGIGECRTNMPEIDTDKIAHGENEADVLVVGSGIAGLFAAVKAHDAGAQVLMVSKGRLGASGLPPLCPRDFRL